MLRFCKGGLFFNCIQKLKINNKNIFNLVHLTTLPKILFIVLTANKNNMNCGKCPPKEKYEIESQIFPIYWDRICITETLTVITQSPLVLLLPVSRSASLLYLLYVSFLLYWCWNQLGFLWFVEMTVAIPSGMFLY